MPPATTGETTNEPQDPLAIARGTVNYGADNRAVADQLSTITSHVLNLPAPANRAVSIRAASERTEPQIDGFASGPVPPAPTDETTNEPQGPALCRARHS